MLSGNRKIGTLCYPATVLRGHHVIRQQNRDTVLSGNHRTGTLWYPAIVKQGHCCPEPYNRDIVCIRKLLQGHYVIRQHKTGTPCYPATVEQGHCVIQKPYNRDSVLTGNLSHSSLGPFRVTAGGTALAVITICRDVGVHVL